MPGNHLISGVSESDWSVICHSHRLKNANSNCFFVQPLPLFPFLTVFLSPSITCVWQVSNGWRGENNVLCTTLQLSAWLRLLLLSEPWGGLPAALFAPLSPSALKPPTPRPLPLPSTKRINPTAAPYKRPSEVHASQYSAPPPTTTGHVAAPESDGGAIRWRVTAGK